MVHDTGRLLHNQRLPSLSKKKPMRYPLALLCALCALFLSACTTTAPDPSVLASAERAIELAEAEGADELSPTELRFARERLTAARQAMENRAYEDVLSSVEKAEINADLALEKSRAAVERRKVNELQRSNALLREELQNTYGEEFDQ